MHFYRLIDTAANDNVIDWFDTRDTAHERAKPLRLNLDLRIELVDLPIDKDSVLALLREEPKFTTLRTWSLSPRGGLVEVPNGE